jgi:hypothetical protein
MSQPDLSVLVEWLGSDLVVALDHRRRQRREYFFLNDTATTETLWLMLAVSLETVRHNLEEILQLAVADLDLSWSVSVAAFCQARDRFSPR